jgi:thiaminase (transcriptional activator TenA)
MQSGMSRHLNRRQFAFGCCAGAVVTLIPTLARAAEPDTFAHFTETQQGTSFTDWLRARAEPSWNAATGHRFTRELAEDRLDDEVFRRYLIQDYVFLDTLAGFIGFAVARAPSLKEKKSFAQFLAAVTGDENHYFVRSFEALSVSEKAYQQPPLNEATRQFRELMTSEAVTGSYETILAVLVPVEWVYLTWATAVADRSPSRFYLKEWIDLHTGAAFRTFVEWMRGELDHRGPQLPPERQRDVEALFRRAVELEVTFFDAAYG